MSQRLFYDLSLIIKQKEQIKELLIPIFLTKDSNQEEFSKQICHVIQTNRPIKTHFDPEGSLATIRNLVSRINSSN